MKSLSVNPLPALDLEQLHDSDHLHDLELHHRLFSQLRPEQKPFFLLRYGEVGLKTRPVRTRFLNTLESNLLRRFREANLSPVLSRERGRVYLFCSDVSQGALLLARTPGIVSFSLCLDIRADFEEILDAFGSLSKNYLEMGDSFAVRARRTGNHPFTSQELAAKAGERVLETNKEKELKVDLTNPEKPLFVEVRSTRAFLYLGTVPGMGGFPVGVGGTVLALLSKNCRPQASLLMMKRGCRVLPVLLRERSLEGPSEEVEDRLLGLEKELNRYHIGVKVWVLDPSHPEAFRGFLKNKKVEGLVFGHDFQGIDRVMEGHLEMKTKLLEEAGFRDEELREFCLKMPFFFPLVWE